MFYGLSLWNAYINTELMSRSRYVYGELDQNFRRSSNKCLISIQIPRCPACITCNFPSVNTKFRPNAALLALISKDRPNGELPILISQICPNATLPALGLIWKFIFNAAKVLFNFLLYCMTLHSLPPTALETFRKASVSPRKNTMTTYHLLSRSPLSLFKLQTVNCR